MQLDVISTSTHLGVRYRYTNEGVVPLYWLNHLFDWFGVLSGDLSKGVALGAQLPPTNAFADGPDGELARSGRWFARRFVQTACARRVAVRRPGRTNSFSPASALTPRAIARSSLPSGA